MSFKYTKYRMLGLALLLLGSASTSHAASPSKSRLILFYGNTKDLGSDQAAANKLSKTDVLVLNSHVLPLEKSQFPNSTACYIHQSDTTAVKLIPLIRAKNPDIKIFVNIPGALDAPEDRQCGQMPPADLNNYWGTIREDTSSPVQEDTWQCPNGICTNFAIAASTVKAFGADGLSIEYAGPLYMNSVVRDNEISYAKNIGLKVMMNVAVTRPDFLDWAAKSTYLKEKDYLLLEGFYSMASLDASAAAKSSLKLYEEKYAAKGLLIAALATSEVYFTGSDGKQYSFSWALENKYPGLYKGKKIDCEDKLARSALEEFQKYWRPGSVFQYTSLEFGYATKILQLCR